jgi:hypothetical protein
MNKWRPITDEPCGSSLPANGIPLGSDCAEHIAMLKARRTPRSNNAYRFKTPLLIFRFNA